MLWRDFEEAIDVDTAEILRNLPDLSEQLTQGVPFLLGKFHLQRSGPLIKTSWRDAT